jgi:hypothetical protein
MTLYQFSALAINEQANAVWDGTLLDSRVEAIYHVHLYAVGDFYVEVYYSNKLNEIVKIRPFRYTSLIQPYLDAMGNDHLKDLLK